MGSGDSTPLPGHGHADDVPCGMNCPVGGADGRLHQATIDGIILCADEPFTAEELDALRQYFALLKATKSEGKNDVG